MEKTFTMQEIEAAFTKVGMNSFVTVSGAVERLKTELLRPKFQRGDRVRWRRSDLGWSYGVIENTSTQLPDYWEIRIDAQDLCCFLHTSQIELTSKFKKGDRVRWNGRSGTIHTAADCNGRALVNCNGEHFFVPEDRLEAAPPPNPGVQALRERMLGQLFTKDEAEILVQQIRMSMR